MCTEQPARVAWQQVQPPAADGHAVDVSCVEGELGVVPLDVSDETATNLIRAFVDQAECARVACDSGPTKDQLQLLGNHEVTCLQDESVIEQARDRVAAELRDVAPVVVRDEGETVVLQVGGARVKPNILGSDGRRQDAGERCAGVNNEFPPELRRSFAVDTCESQPATQSQRRRNMPVQGLARRRSRIRPVDDRGRQRPVLQFDTAGWNRRPQAARAS